MDYIDQYPSLKTTELNGGLLSVLYSIILEVFTPGLAQSQSLNEGQSKLDEIQGGTGTRGGTKDSQGSVGLSFDIAMGSIGSIGVGLSGGNSPNTSPNQANISNISNISINSSAKGSTKGSPKAKKHNKSISQVSQVPQVHMVIEQYNISHYYMIACGCLLSKNRSFSILYSYSEPDMVSRVYIGVYVGVYVCIC